MMMYVCPLFSNKQITLFKENQVKDGKVYSRLCLNLYLSVDIKKYGLLQSMGFGRAHPRAIFWVM